MRTSVYLRDHSFYAHSHGGSAGHYHFLGNDLASACGRARVLLIEEPHKPGAIAPALRCKAPGCAQKWKKHERVNRETA